MQKHIKFKLIAASFILSLFLFPCLSRSEIQTLTDMRGRSVTIPGEVSRVVCIGRGSLRMLCYLHAADRVVGVEFPERKETSHARPYLVAYSFLKDLPLIGFGAQGDPELILQTTPQLIFYADGDLQSIETMQSKTGVPVVGITCGNLTEGRSVFYDCLKLMADVLDKETRCDSLIRGIDQQFEAISELASQYHLSDFFAYIGGLVFKGRHGITSTQARFTPFELLGLNNVASELRGNANTPAEVHIEQLAKWNPDVIFTDMATRDQIAQDMAQYPLLQILSAVQNKQMFEIYPARLYGENFETTLVNTFLMAYSLVPEQAPTFHKKAMELYTLFLNAKAGEIILSTYGIPSP